MPRKLKAPYNDSMNGWTPWFVAGFLILVMLVLPFLYREAKTALLKRQGFVPLDALLKRKGVTGKKFWRQVEARGLKVRLKSRGVTTFIVAEDAAAVIDTLPPRETSDERLARDLRLVGLSAVASAAASALFSDTESPDIPDGTIVARADDWTLEKRETTTEAEDEAVWEVDIYRYTFNPAGCRTPVDLWSKIRTLAPPVSRNEVLVEILVVGLKEWLRTAEGLSPTAQSWLRAAPMESLSDSEFTAKLAQTIAQFMGTHFMRDGWEFGADRDARDVCLNRPLHFPSLGTVLCSVSDRGSVDYYFFATWNP